MNEHKICFIACVNDESYYEKMLQYIAKLKRPEGIEIEVRVIRQAKSMCSAYNVAMKSSDAKYKVYLHQDTFILNLNFIEDVINLFKRYPSLGLVGMDGSDNLKQSPIWWQNHGLWGMAYSTHTGSLERYIYGRFDEDYKVVEAIDGFIMITQYDILWREDIFDGWHAYDLSQCQEFKRYGYEVGIPRQQEPWTLHDSGIVNLDHYDEYLRLFINTYLNH